VLRHRTLHTHTYIYIYIHNRMSNVKKKIVPTHHQLTGFSNRYILFFGSRNQVPSYNFVTSAARMECFGVRGVWKWTSVRFVRGRLITQILCRDNGAMLNVMSVQWIRHCHKRLKKATGMEQAFIEAGYIQVSTEIVKTEHNLTFLKVRHYDRMFTTIWTTTASFCSCWLIRREKWHLKFWFELQ
jgi:hypothetical protein